MPDRQNDASLVDERPTEVSQDERLIDADYLDELLEDGRARSVFGSCARSRILALCVEPGMGVEEMVVSIVALHAQQGHRVYRHDLLALSPSDASSLMVRVCREATRSKSPAFVAFENVPPSDEGGVRRQARAVRRLIESGISCVLTLAPEARQLLEPLPECLVLGSRDLLARRVMGAERGEAAYPIRRLTHGIPTLVRGLLSARLAEGRVVDLPASYTDAFRALVDGCLRLTLSDEELRLRYALLLLGQGTLHDLEVALGPVPSELVGMVADNVALLEFSSDLTRFSALRGHSLRVLASLRPELSSMAGLFPDVLVGVVRALTERGDYARAAAICDFSRSLDWREVALGHGAGFLEAGCTNLMRDVLGPGPSIAPDGSRDFALWAATRALSLSNPGREVFSWAPDEQEATGGGLREALLFLDARRALRALPPLVAFAEGAWSELETRLLAHREATQLMAQGRFASAMRLLVANPGTGDGPSVSRALLRIDLELARLFLCDPPVQGTADLERARGMLSSEQLRGLSGTAASVSVLRGLLGEGESAGALADDLVSRAERSGDVVVQVFALVAGCVFDLRRGALARAGVRSVLARAVAGRAGLEYLARVAVMVGDVARGLSGDEVTPLSVQPHDDLGRVCVVLYETLVPEGELAHEEVDLPDDPPREALWLLVALSIGVGDFSRRLLNASPPSWRQALMRLGAGWAAASSGAAPAAWAGDAWAGRPPLDAAPIQIRLLGDFVLNVRGVRVPDARLEQRGAKSMLEFLALRHGAAARRHQLVEQVWPDCEYGAGFGRVYQATSVVRSIVSEIGDGLDPFIVSRTTRAVSLDPALVSVDVDEFRTCAREASDARDDMRALEMARRAEELYTGDLYLPAVDATGFVSARRDELRELYADAMVAGSDAALRLGRRRTAVRLAQNALAINELREDAVIALVRGLRASGRNVEAEQQYRRYARRLMLTVKEPPSRLLRRAALGEREERPGVIRQEVVPA